MKKYLLLFLLIATCRIYSQGWEFVGLDSLLVKQIYVSGDTIFAGTDNRMDTTKESGLFRSIDDGKTWVKLDSSLGNGPILGFEKANNGTIYIIKGNLAYALAGVIYKSLDGGNTWERIIVGDRAIKWIRVSSFDNNKIYAVDFTFGYNEVYKSTDGGNSWNIISSFPASSHGRFVAFNFSLAKDSLLFALVDTQFDQYFYRSTDDGFSWTYVSQPPTTTNEIVTDGDLNCRVYLQSYFITDDCGLNWLQTDSIDFALRSYYLSLFIDDKKSKLYMMKTTGIYESGKIIINWKKVEGSENLPFSDFDSGDIGQLKNINVNDSTDIILVGTSKGIYEAKIITSIESIAANPRSFSLLQNYPNPFNPTTRIRYIIPKLSFVSLRIYDLLGREVTTLVNEEQQTGNYEVEFNAKNLSSGIYIYTIRAGSFAENKKMTLIK